jgi:hypothetical protein
MMCELWTGYLCGFLHHAWWILAAVAIFIAVKSMFPKYPAIRLAVLGSWASLLPERVLFRGLCFRKDLCARQS